MKSVDCSGQRGLNILLLEQLILIRNPLVLLTLSELWALFHGWTSG